jgi:hypothetical protein
MGESEERIVMQRPFFNIGSAGRLIDEGISSIKAGDFVNARRTFEHAADLQSGVEGSSNAAFKTRCSETLDEIESCLEAIGISLSANSIARAFSRAGDKIKVIKDNSSLS